MLSIAPVRSFATIIIASLLLAAVSALAQPAPATAPGGVGAIDIADAPVRRILADGRVAFAFKQKPVDEQMLSFITEATGKLVMPIGDLMTSETPRITLVTGDPIDSAEALDMLFRAFRLNGIGVIEKPDVIVIGRTADLMQHKRMPVLSADADVMSRSDRGSLVIKVFRLAQVRVEDVAQQLAEQLPAGTEMSVDAGSNQVVLCADIAACQQVQRLIDELDHSRRHPATRIIQLEYADAGEVAQHIELLFADDDGPAASSVPRRTTPPRGPRQRGDVPTGAAPGTEVPLRVAVDLQQNNITVVGDAEEVRQIEYLVAEAWDLPRPFGTSKLYVLEHTDPIKMRDIIRELLGVSSGSGSSSRVRTSGGDSDVVRTISGVYRFEAFPDKNALVAICKTEQAFDFLDDLILKLDQPSTIALPVKVPLHHADAGRLAQEINALLADGSVSLPLAERGLRGGGLADRGAGGGGGGGGGGGEDMNADSATEISFPWQSTTGRNAERSPESNLIGQVRVVPIVRENALAVMAPPAHRIAMKELIEAFDQPARQVMISAVIAEVELTDDLVLGLRMASGALPLSTTENTLGVSIDGSASEGGFLDALFDTSVLDASFSVSAAIQALAGQTRVRVLHEPRIFTSDNMEAIFFDGQEVPFISDSNTFDSGGVSQGFSYRPVGLILDVRPHITARHDVNLEVNIELSSVVPGQTLFGGFVIDQRQTRTNVTLRNGQTVVLSGLLREDETEVQRKVPFLGDLPILGGLFRSREETVRNTELLIFLTPHVLEDGVATDTYRRADLEQLRDLSRPFDEQPGPDEMRERMRRRGHGDSSD